MDHGILIMNHMKQLGFSEYECKAYLKLLEIFPLTGYTLSKNSGVPISRIYDVLESLMKKQMVFVQEEEKKERYLSIIIDGIHTVSGVVSRGEDSKVTWTQDEGFIEISEDYIAHDLVVNLYSASLGKKTYKKFEEFSDSVQKHYFNYSDEEFATYKNIK